MSIFCIAISAFGGMLAARGFCCYVSLLRDKGKEYDKAQDARLMISSLLEAIYGVGLLHLAIAAWKLWGGA